MRRVGGSWHGRAWVSGTDRRVHQERRAGTRVRRRGACSYGYEVELAPSVLSQWEWGEPLPRTRGCRTRVRRVRMAAVTSRTLCQDPEQGTLRLGSVGTLRRA